MWRWTVPGASELVSECEAYLSGTYAELADVAGLRVQPWAWLNLLAHGSEADLRRERNLLWHSAPLTTPAWQRARAFLAGDIVDMIDAGDATLVELQHTVLIPLELSLPDLDPMLRWDTGQLVTRVRDGLGRRRASSRR